MDFSFYPVTLVIIIATVLLSIRAFNDADVKYKWIYYPYKLKRNNEWYRTLSHMFIHADYVHLFFNMFVLFSFGRLMEFQFIAEYGRSFGHLHFFLLYFLGGLAAGVWPFLRNADNPNYMSLGASGAVSAVLFASILWYPQGGIYLMFIPVEIPAWLFGILYLGFEYYMSKRGNTGVAHDAHFGGAVFGLLYILLINFDKGKAFISYIFS
jgi:membrane associated rhomboid family serine protease